MSDVWEIQYGLNPSDPIDALEDPDGDTWNNLLEFLKRTDPTHKDTDGDGINDDSDAFPTDEAASVDSDGDNYPDFWNPGKNVDDSTTGLKLDEFPNNPNKYSKTQDDGSSFGAFAIFAIVLIIIVILILLQLTLTILRKKQTDSNLPVFDDPKVNNDIRDLYLTANKPYKELIYADMMARLTDKYQNGELSKNTYDYIIENVLKPVPGDTSEILNNDEQIQGKF
jgi:hypothetical protein